MESIYHHTSFNVLKSIVTDTGLNFRASKYSNYINGEYEWIKDKANVAIQEMCEEQGEPFDSAWLGLITIKRICRSVLLASNRKNLNKRRSIGI